MHSQDAPVATPLPPGGEESPAGVSASVDRSADREGFSWKKLLWITWPLGVIVLLGAIGVPLCPTKNLFGIPCPGCGLTRATTSMATGDFAAMLHYHPLAPLITPVAIYALLRAFLVSAGAIPVSRPDWMGKLPRWVWGLVGVALIGLWIVRMAGGLGGHPDPIDPTTGWLYRGGHWLFSDLPALLGLTG